MKNNTTQEQNTHIISMNASAGSGKTHNLKRRFLKLLSEADWEISPEQYAYVRSAKKKYAFSEILALTFTNAAATQMQERILRSLKGIALGLEKDEDNKWTSQSAKQAVEQIFMQYSALNIKTIDSLLHHLVRLSSLELEISPQFDVSFDNQKLITPIFQECAKIAREDEYLSNLFDNVCISIIENKKPFTDFFMKASLIGNCAKIVQTLITEKEKMFAVKNDKENPFYERIKKLSQALETNGLGSLEFLYEEIEALLQEEQEYAQALEEATLQENDASDNYVIQSPSLKSSTISDFTEKSSNTLYKNSSLPLSFASLTSKHELQHHLKHAEHNMLQSAQALQKHIDDDAIPCSSYFTTPFKNLFSGMYKNTPYFAKESFIDCVNKKGKDKVSMEACTCYQNFSKNALDYFALADVIPQALLYLSLLALATKIEEKVWEYEKENGLLLTDRITALVNKALHDEHFLGATLCRMGSHVSHILFDEFQDTSKTQWQALEPLVREALAVNGSVFFVGDVKQAIYGWRGGDSALFHSAPKSLIDNMLENNLIKDEDSWNQNENKYSKEEILKNNWRSEENIVDWNNAFFSHFTQQRLVNSFMQSFLLKAEKPLAPYIEKALQESLANISNSFRSVIQQIPERQKKKEKKGLVQVHKINVPKNKVNLAILSLLPSAIQNLRDTRDFAWKDICILTTTNQQASRVSETLLSQDIPVVSQGSLLMAQHPLIQEIIACMRFLAHPMNTQAFFEVLSSKHLLPVQISSVQLMEFTGQSKEISLFIRFKEKFPELWSFLFKDLVDNAGLMTAYDSLCEIYKRFEIRERQPQAEVFLLRLLEIVHLAEENACLDLSSFLLWWDEEGKEEKAPLPQETDAVSIMTIHKAKGLEFKAVLIPWHNFTIKADTQTPQLIEFSYNDTQLKLFSPLLKEHGYPYYTSYFNKVEESINALYVAWTRAREELHIFIPEEAPSYDNVFPLFVQSMLDEFYQNERDVQKNQDPEKNQENQNENEREQTKKLQELVVQHIEDDDAYKSYGSFYNTHSKEQSKEGLLTPLYLRLFDFWLCKDENSAQAQFQNTSEFLKAHLKAQPQNQNDFQFDEEENLQTAKSDDNTYYAMSIASFFARLKRYNRDYCGRDDCPHSAIIQPVSQKHMQNNENTGFSKEIIPGDAELEIQSLSEKDVKSKNSVLIDLFAFDTSLFNAEKSERPMSWLPRIKVFQSNLKDLYINQKEEISANKRGTLMHKCLENIVYSGDIKNDAKRAINAVFGLPDVSLFDSQPLVPHGAVSPFFMSEKTDAVRTYQSIDKNKIYNAITWFLGLTEHYGGAKQWLQYALKEHALASAEGKMYRVDLLVNRPDFIRSKDDNVELLAIDYKTGYDGILPDQDNVKQIQNYLTLLDEGLGENDHENVNGNAHEFLEERKDKKQGRGENGQDRMTDERLIRKERVKGMLIYLDREEVHLVSLPLKRKEFL